MTTTLLIDGNSVIHTIPITECKQYSDFKRIFFSRLREYTKQFTSMPSAYLFFDDKLGGTWRNDIFPDYQIGRKRAREKYTERQKEESALRHNYLVSIQEDIKNNSKYGYLSYPHTEADDLIALYCKNIQKDNEKVIILTTDKDLFQLIKEKSPKLVQVLFLIKRQLISSEKEGKEMLRRKICLGDNSDSIPGICKNVGEKTYPDFHAFIIKALKENINYSNVEEAKQFCIKENLRYIPSFSNYDKNQHNINNILIDLNYVVEKDKKEDGIKTKYLESMLKTVKFSPFAFYSLASMKN